MTDLQWFALAVALFALTLPASIVFLALKVRGMYTITVQQPSVTVQAPVAELPGHVADLLQRLNEKLSPKTIEVGDAAVSLLVEQGVTLASEALNKNGRDKFRIAKNFVITRLKEQNAAFAERDIALRIEAEVAGRRVAGKLKK